MSFSFADILSSAVTKSEKLFATPAENAEEAMSRLFAMCLIQWQQGKEPISSEMGRLMAFLSDKNDPMYAEQRWDIRTGLALAVHQIVKQREKAHAGRKPELESGT